MECFSSDGIIYIKFEQIHCLFIYCHHPTKLPIIQKPEYEVSDGGFGANKSDEFNLSYIVICELSKPLTNTSHA